MFPSVRPHDLPMSASSCPKDSYRSPTCISSAVTSAQQRHFSKARFHCLLPAHQTHWPMTLHCSYLTCRNHAQSRRTDSYNQSARPLLPPMPRPRHCPVTDPHKRSTYIHCHNLRSPRNYAPATLHPHPDGRLPKNSVPGSHHPIPPASLHDW